MTTNFMSQNVEYSDELCRGTRDLGTNIGGQFSFECTGYRGGDAGHGGYLMFAFKTESGTSVTITVDGQEFDGAKNVSISLTGDDEIQDGLLCFEFMVNELRRYPYFDNRS